MLSVLGPRREQPEEKCFRIKISILSSYTKNGAETTDARKENA